MPNEDFDIPKKLRAILYSSLKAILREQDSPTITRKSSLGIEVRET